MSKAKFFFGDQEVSLPERGRGASVFGAAPAELRPARALNEAKNSPIHDAIVAVIDHEELGGVAHVEDIQAGLHHLHGLSYKTGAMHSHLKNASDRGRIFRVPGARGYYSTVQIAAVPGAQRVHASAPADRDEDDAPADRDEVAFNPSTHAPRDVRQNADLREMLPKAGVAPVRHAVGRVIR